MISQRYKLNELTSKILAIRNIKEEDLDFFLNPDIQNHLPDPYILKDMKKSTDKVSMLFSDATFDKSFGKPDSDAKKTDATKKKSSKK